MVNFKCHSLAFCNLIFAHYFYHSPYQKQVYYSLFSLIVNCSAPSGPRTFVYTALSLSLTPPEVSVESGAEGESVDSDWMKKWKDRWMNECIYTLRIYKAKNYYVLPSALRKSLWVQTPPRTAWQSWAHPRTTRPRSRHWTGLWGAGWFRPSSPQVRTQEAARP